MQQAGIAVGGLTCENRVDPLGIDDMHPRLSWLLTSGERGQVQTAWQVRVASSPAALNINKGDIWDSHKVMGSESHFITYQGRALESRKIYYWKVRVWDINGRASAWSEPARWEMGLLDPGDWSGAVWIDDGKTGPETTEEFYADDPAPLFRKEFSIEKGIARARLYITGLGYYEASMNGMRIGDARLDPAWTHYGKQIYYSVYDVTEFLKEEMNCLGVTLGNGWYNPLPLKMWGSRNIRESLPHGRPGLLCQLFLEYSDGSVDYITSDERWKVADGPLLRNNVYLGEVYDARREIRGWNLAGYQDHVWRTPGLAPEIQGRLISRDLPPIRITRNLPVKEVSEPSPGIWVFDMGQNFAGWVSMKVNVPEGTRITLRYGELLNSDGTLNPLTSVCGQIKGMTEIQGERVPIGGPGAPDVAWQQDVYTARGDGPETYTPTFTYHGFRYVEVSGLPGEPAPGMIEGHRMNSDVPVTGHFSCSDSLLNRIQEMCDWTFRSNIFSVQSDCPHREKFGYGGDIAATSEAFIMNYDMHGFYGKTVRDWQDAALDDGMFTDTSPFVGIQYCGLAWASVHPLLQYQMYVYYGDKQLIEQQYAAAKKWLDLIALEYPGHIITEGLSDHSGLTERPEEVMITPLYYYTVSIMGEMAGILEMKDDMEYFKKLGEDIAHAYNERFLDTSTGKVGPGTQGAQIFALYTGILPEAYRELALSYLVRNIREKNEGHLNTGIYGTKFLLDYLSSNGHHDLSYEIVTQKDFPGWGFMLENGATTLWETWGFSDNVYSHNHPMFGSVSQWFYHWLGGIRPGRDCRGFNRIILAPAMDSPLKWVKCSYQSVHGEVACNWEKSDLELRIEVKIPIGASAEIHLPAGDVSQVSEGDRMLEESRGIEIIRKETGKLICNLIPGSYKFKIKL